ncbi:MAG: hypothetical protein AAB512_03610 [Patescibacteria group bacterium]
MKEQDNSSTIDIDMSLEPSEDSDPKVFPELKVPGNFGLTEFRSRPENVKAELDAQAISFIRVAMLKKHQEPDFHTPEIDEQALAELNSAETVDSFKSAIKAAYPNPEHMLVDASRFFEEHFPGNGRNGESFDSLFEAGDGTFGVEMVNIRTRARKIIAELKDEFGVKTPEPALS